MAQDNIDQSVSDNVEERLEMLFGEDDVADAPEEESETKAVYPLRDLKTIVLSIDWEITDEVMKNFATQVSALKQQYTADKIVSVLLQLLGSIGEYIRINLAKSHPDAIKLLNSLFSQLDKIVRSPDMSEAEKKKILATQVNKYKQLKQSLATVKTDKGSKKPEEQAPVKSVETAPAEDMMAVLVEIKQILRSEMKSIREELQKLQKALKVEG